MVSMASPSATTSAWVRQFLWWEAGSRVQLWYCQGCNTFLIIRTRWRVDQQPKWKTKDPRVRCSAWEIFKKKNLVQPFGVRSSIRNQVMAADRQLKQGAAWLTPTPVRNLLGTETTVGGAGDKETSIVRCSTATSNKRVDEKKDKRYVRAILICIWS